MDELELTWRAKHRDWYLILSKRSKGSNRAHRIDFDEDPDSESESTRPGCQSDSFYICVRLHVVSAFFVQDVQRLFCLPKLGAIIIKASGGEKSSPFQLACTTSVH